MLKVKTVITDREWKQFEIEVNRHSQETLDRIKIDTSYKPEKPLKFQGENKTKLGKIAHFSTMPIETCIQNCSYCYSMKSVRMYPTVKSNYRLNTDSLNNGISLPNVPKNRDVARMYVGGDFQNIHSIKEWIKLSFKYNGKNDRLVTFYGYTKQWKNKQLLPFLELLKDMPNVVLRASVDEKTGYNVPDGWIKSGILENNKKEGKYFVCKSNKKNGLKCDKCKICFLPKFQHVPVYFPKH